MSEIENSGVADWRAPSHEIILETEGNTDQFSTIYHANERLYNQRLFTPESQVIWQKLPDLLKRNSEALKLTMGSSKVSVHLHGSMLIGVGNEGKSDTEGGKMQIGSSDVDLFILVGEHDNYDEKYQAENAEEIASANRVGLQQKLIDEKRGDYLMSNSSIQEELGHRVEIVVVNVSDILDKLKALSNKFENGGRPDSEDFWDYYNWAMIFGSDSQFETQEGCEAEFRNNILASILSLPHGEKIWEGIRHVFNKYTVKYEEFSTHASNKAQEARQKRVAIAFDEVFDNRNIPEKHRERAKEYLRRQREVIQLPTFEIIQTLKEKLSLKGK